jgi:nitric oxide synthase oxygenase domain/subunit
MPYKDPLKAKQHRAAYYAANRAKAIQAVAQWRLDHREQRNAAERTRNAIRLRTDQDFRKARLQHTRNSYRRHKAKRLLLAAKHRKTVQALARQLLRNAVRRKDIVKPLACDACSAITRLHGHHTDYSQPLLVVWLCPLCHGDVHRHRPEN